MKKVIIFIGPPGCGKGSTVNLRFSNLGCRDILRSEMLQIISKYIETHSCALGYLFDGFPRTSDQAKGLTDILKAHGLSVNQVVKFSVDDEALIQRAVGRLVHLPSGRVYHAKNYPPKVPNCDDITGEPLTHRADDTEEVIKKRIATYEKTTRPVLMFYDKDKLVVEVDANDDLQAVTGVIDQSFENILKHN
ncbi:hypothetical protein MXB_425 [Myxobolus squamalis]|nr:hypothetical protein MXB_425 [Myxobolus squamalis]